MVERVDDIGGWYTEGFKFTNNVLCLNLGGIIINVHFMISKLEMFFMLFYVHAIFFCILLLYTYNKNEQLEEEETVDS